MEEDIQDCEGMKLQPSKFKEVRPTDTQLNNGEHSKTNCKATLRVTSERSGVLNESFNRFHGTEYFRIS